MTYHSYWTVQSYARQLNTLTNGTASLAVYSDFNTYAFKRFIADWSFENMNPKVTTCVCR